MANYTARDIHGTLYDLRRQFPTGVTTHSICSRCKTHLARGAGPCKACLEDELRVRWGVPDQEIQSLLAAHAAVQAAIGALEEVTGRVVKAAESS